MTDTYNPFYDDLKARKAPVASSYHRKSGAKSKKCSLPSDNLSAAQRRKLNGPVKEWNVRKPMPWADFKAMPADIQQEHIDFIVGEFPGIGAATIAREVFGISQTTFPKHAQSHGLTIPIRPTGVKTPPDTLAALRGWVAGADSTDEEPCEEAAETAAHTEEPAAEKAAAEKAAPGFSVSRIEADLSGSAEDLMTYIRIMLGGRNASLRIGITFE